MSHFAGNQIENLGEIIGNSDSTTQRRLSFETATNKVHRPELFTQAAVEVYLKKAREFQFLQMSDDYRVPEAYKDGGFPLNDQEAISKYRKAFKNLLS
mmetsp:Transcript_35773/g.54785  ORF Transcript_35773/g.54785 Transcript_35773/m.54785 type:complete len:98 (-) Transcript_35773:917-1210(-)